MPDPFVADLNERYETLHTAKEDAFWTAYMGLAADADAARKTYQEREVAWKRFVQDPERLAAARARLADHGAALGDDDRRALEGWIAMFEAHVIEDADARELAEWIVGLEGDLAQARSKMELGFRRSDGSIERASSVRLSVMIDNDPDEARRRAAWDGLRAIEPFVLENGFLEIVQERNRLGRIIGGEDYYDARVRRTERMSKREIFDLLDGLEERTREAGRRAIDELRAEHGDELTKPWNVRYLVAGDVTAEQDPYFPFSHSFERWARSFAAMNIEYRNAELVLDLVDREGKYENGFMHGPVPAWRDANGFRPARIHFTANAIPGMTGAGKRATQTFFHEGGHAAHFANIDQPAPCFAQEHAPMSVALAEVQSMFLDSLLSDADWQTRYARTAGGRAMPRELIERGIRAAQPLRAWSLRAGLAICYAERAVYEIPDDELTAERVTEEIRNAERRFCFLDEGSPRPTLAVPHLLAGESSAYYHGYLLALMGVYQTRAFFLERDGHLTDNPRIGPELRDAYWRGGTAVRFVDAIGALTGRPLTAEALAESVNRTADEEIAEAERMLARSQSVPRFEGEAALGAKIRVVHGNEAVASGSVAEIAPAFAEWIDGLAARADA